MPTTPNSAFPCLCPDCTPNPAPTYTQEYRLQCLFRHLAALPNDARIRAMNGMSTEHQEKLLAELDRRQGRLL